MIQIFQAHLHITSARIWQKPWLFHKYSEEVYDLASSVQLKIKTFLGTALSVDEPVQEPDKREDVHYTWPIATQGQKRTMPQNQLDSANNVVSVFAGNIQFEFAMVAYNEILFYISYSLRLAFRLCSSMIGFYTSLEVIKFTFLENESRYICLYSLASYSHLKQKVNQCFQKNRVMRILQTQLLTLFFLIFIIHMN